MEKAFISNVDKNSVNKRLIGAKRDDIEKEDYDTYCLTFPWTPCIFSPLVATAVVTRSKCKDTVSTILVIISSSVAPIVSTIVKCFYCMHL